jgi:hypothetical protein
MGCMLLNQKKGVGRERERERERERTSRTALKIPLIAIWLMYNVFFYPVGWIIITQMEFTDLPGLLCKS